MRYSKYINIGAMTWDEWGFTLKMSIAFGVYESSTKGIGRCVSARRHVSDDVYETRWLAQTQTREFSSE